MTGIASASHELIKMGVVPATALWQLKDSPPHQTGPIDLARKAGQRFTGECADDPFAVLAVDQRSNQVDLGLSCRLGDLGACNTRALQPLVEPGDE